MIQKKIEHMKNTIQIGETIIKRLGKEETPEKRKSSEMNWQIKTCLIIMKF